MCDRRELLSLVFVLEENSGCINKDVFSTVSNTAVHSSDGQTVNISLWNRCTDIFTNNTSVTVADGLKGKCSPNGQSNFGYVYYGETILGTLAAMNLTILDDYLVYLTYRAESCTLISYDRLIGITFPSYINYSRPTYCQRSINNISVEVTTYSNLKEKYQLIATNGAAAWMYLSLSMMLLIVLMLV